jgi:predicted TPR repeat methyltransferase
MTDLNRAMQLHLEGKYADSEALYRQLLEAHPDPAKIMQCLGFLLQQTGRLEEALEFIESSLAIDDAHAEWHYNHGIVLEKLGRSEDAAKAFSRSLSLNRNNYFCWTNLGAVLEKGGAFEQAEQAYREAVMLNPQCMDAYYLLASLFASQGRFIEAKHFNSQGIIYDPVENKSKIKLGLALYETGRQDDAIRLMKSWCDTEPGNPVALHMLAAFRETNAPERCTAQYVETTFDNFAHDFESVLSRLDYAGPRLLKEALCRLGFQKSSLKVLDLGCGTGLNGPVLKPISKILTGVDLSSAMLGKAQDKNCYDFFFKSEICEFLDRESARFDLITCIDTLIYFGNLEAVFRKIHARLEKGGSFIFTTETGSDGFDLDVTGRYRHAENYVTGLLEQAGFTPPSIEDAVIRRESARPVYGQLFIASKIH